MGVNLKWRRGVNLGGIYTKVLAFTLYWYHPLV